MSVALLLQASAGLAGSSLLVAFDTFFSQQRKLKRIQALRVVSISTSEDINEQIAVHYRQVRLIDKRVFSNQHVEKSPHKSFRGAHLILRLLTSYKDHEAIIGDLEEIYPTILDDHGWMIAHVWYWKQAISAVVMHIVERVLTIGERIRRFIS